MTNNTAKKQAAHPIRAREGLPSNNMIGRERMIAEIGHNSTNLDNSQEAKTAILNIIVDLSDADEIVKYLEHIKFDICAVSNLQNTDEWLSALFGHYRIKKGHYDMDRITMDLAQYPPIAARIVELIGERAKV